MLQKISTLRSLTSSASASNRIYHLTVAFPSLRLSAAAATFSMCRILCVLCVSVCVFEREGEEEKERERERERERETYLSSIAQSEKQR